MKFIMYNKNGCGQGYSLSIGAWHVGVVIMVPRNHFQKLRPMWLVRGQSLVTPSSAVVKWLVHQTRRAGAGNHARAGAAWEPCKGWGCMGTMQGLGLGTMQGLGAGNHARAGAGNHARAGAGNHARTGAGNHARDGAGNHARTGGWEPCKDWGLGTMQGLGLGTMQGLGLGTMQGLAPCKGWGWDRVTTAWKVKE